MGYWNKGTEMGIEIGVIFKMYHVQHGAGDFCLFILFLNKGY